MGNHRPLLRSSQRGLDHLKYEVAADLGLDDDIQSRGWGNMTTREVGKIGGTMVKRLIQKAEQDIATER
jgi:hypothetical protein